jgi:hypothetical protein
MTTLRSVLENLLVERDRGDRRAEFELTRVLCKAGDEASYKASREGTAYAEAASVRSDLVEGEDFKRAWESRQWRVNATYYSLSRELLTCPNTLRALVKGSSSPVHGNEREKLARRVAQHLLIAGSGKAQDEKTLRKVNYELLKHLSLALGKEA